MFLTPIEYIVRISISNIINRIIIRVKGREVAEAVAVVVVVEGEADKPIIAIIVWTKEDRFGVGMVEISMGG